MLQRILHIIKNVTPYQTANTLKMVANSLQSKDSKKRLRQRQKTQSRTAYNPSEQEAPKNSSYYHKNSILNG
jgi:hypothetical protein